MILKAISSWQSIMVMKTIWP